jgi:hypothetical protein
VKEPNKGVAKYLAEMLKVGMIFGAAVPRPTWEREMWFKSFGTYYSPYRLECKFCGAWWVPKMDTDGNLLPEDGPEWWTCPSGCNDPTSDNYELGDAQAKVNVVAARVNEVNLDVIG